MIRVSETQADELLWALRRHTAREGEFGYSHERSWRPAGDPQITMCNKRTADALHRAGLVEHVYRDWPQGYHAILTPRGHFLAAQLLEADELDPEVAHAQECELQPPHSVNDCPDR